MKIGIYGGSFDPIHNDHVSICLKFKKELALDKVIVFPAYQSPFKKGHFTDGKHRLQMALLAFKDYPFIEVSDFELNGEGISYTYLTLSHVKNLYPEAELFLLIGYDSLKGFLKWKNVDFILANASIAVADRGGCDFDKQKSIFKQATGLDFYAIENHGTISSTYVRELLMLGVYSELFIDKEVYDYITKNNLYPTNDFYLKIRKRLKYGRLLHTAGVVATAVSYAKRTGESVEKARIAALLHDIAKHERVEDYPDCIIPEGAPESVKHQYLGAYIAKNYFAISDEDVLNAIRYHTTGRPQMSLLEKIVFTADLLEPSREYDEVEELRIAVESDFEAGFRRCVERLIEYLKRSASEIFYLTTLTNEYYNKKS